MKDQNAIHEEESQDQKWNRGLDLYIESVQKPDHALRGCAHNQKCFNELMEVREQVLEYVYGLRASSFTPSSNRMHYEMVHDSEGC